MLYFVALNLRFHSHNVAEHENSCFEIIKHSFIKFIGCCILVLNGTKQGV